MSTGRQASRCFMLAQNLIGPLRQVARTHGYALPEHGSLARDIDLVAVPWTADACDPFVLAEALRVKAAEINGYADVAPHEKNGEFPRLKPHGRLCWSFQLGGGVYIDLSVFPRFGDAAKS